MGAMKTVCAALLVGLTALPLPLRADDMALRLADCAGRLVAQMEHEWLVSDPAAAGTEGLLDAVGAVLDLMAPGGTVATNHSLVSARAAHRQLLSAGRFGGDPRALQAAQDYILGCAALVVPPPLAAGDTAALSH
jgi:hypothetical protein